MPLTVSNLGVAYMSKLVGSPLEWGRPTGTWPRDKEFQPCQVPINPSLSKRYDTAWSTPHIYLYRGVGLGKASIIQAKKVGRAVCLQAGPAWLDLSGLNEAKGSPWYVPVILLRPIMLEWMPKAMQRELLFYGWLVCRMLAISSQREEEGGQSWCFTHLHVVRVLNSHSLHMLCSGSVGRFVLCYIVFCLPFYLKPIYFNFQYCFTWN